MNATQVKAPTTSIIQRFSTHLEEPKNTNIIFSGKYGIGKTYFIRNYFENHKDKYNLIYTTPLGYSVANNEDIFELIKFDIIRSLYKDEFITSTEKRKASFFKVLKEFALNRPIDLAAYTAKGLSKLHPALEFYTNYFEGIQKLKASIEEYEKEFNKTTVDNSAIDYMQNYATQTGHYRENNIISQFISLILKDLKQTEERPKPKENILVIDDFDRIDPEHVFRILNVFSVHDGQLGNKFGFDKVIIVCDYDNIKYLFQHRYGEKANFTGYFDKFYSKEIFHFHHADVIASYIDNDLGLSLGSDANNNLLKDIIKLFFEADLISMRQVVRIKDLELKNDTILWDQYQKAYIVKLEHLPFLHLIPILSVIAGNYDDLKKWLRDDGINFRSYEIKNLKYVALSVLKVTAIFNELLDKRLDNDYKIEGKLPRGNFTYQYQMHPYYDNPKDTLDLGIILLNDTNSNYKRDYSISDFLQLLYHFMTRIEEKGLLHKIVPSARS